jgi:hypothetical protein
MTINVKETKKIFEYLNGTSCTNNWDARKVSSGIEYFLLIFTLRVELDTELNSQSNDGIFNGGHSTKSCVFCENTSFFKQLELCPKILHKIANLTVYSSIFRTDSSKKQTKTN